MDPLSLVFFAAAVAAVPVSRRLTGDYFPPAALIVVVWCVTLGAFRLRLLPYPPLLPDTVWLLGGSILLMSAGAIAGARLVSGRPRPPREAAETPVPYANVWVLAYAAIALLGIALYLREVDRVFGLETLVHRPYIVRLAIGDRTISSAFLFFEYFCIITPIVAAAMRLTGTPLRPLVWVAVAGCVLATWITTDRTQFFLVAMTVYFLVVFRRGPRWSFGRLVGVTAVAGIVLVGSFLAIESWMRKWAVGVSVVEVRSPSPPVRLLRAAWAQADGGSGPPDPMGATAAAATAVPGPDPAAPPDWRARLKRVASRSTTLYLYATGSIAALNSLVADAPPRTHGVHTFYPLARALQRIGVISGPLPDAVLPDRPIGMTTGPDLRFNTYTFLSYPYEDFGAVGAAVYAGVVGLVSGVVYGFVRRRRSSPAALLALAQISGGIVLSIFVNKFNNTASWYILVCSLLPFAAAGLLRRRATGSRTA